MKTILNLCAVCALVALVGCSSTKTNAVSPGAVGNGKEKTGCGGCTSDASMGAVGEKKAGCGQSSEAGASMGAVGEKTDCSGKVCPVSGQSAESAQSASDASLGAVSEKKTGCCSSKTSG